jgi:biotin operon repressor
MLNARAYAPKIEARSPQTKRIPDERSSLARQSRRIIELAYKEGCCFMTAKNLATDLGISEKTVGKNNAKLKAASLVEIDPGTGRKVVNKIYPLPRSQDKRKRRKAWTAKALACTELDLPYRLLWLLQEKSWHGEPVKDVSLTDLGAVLNAKRQNVWQAVQINKARGYLTTRGGPGKVLEFHLTGVFRMEPSQSPDLDATRRRFDFSKFRNRKEGRKT